MNVVMFYTLGIHAQELPRKPFHGFRSQPCEGGGVIVGGLAPNGTALAMGLHSGDTLLLVNDRPIGGERGLTALSETKVGEHVSYTVKHGDERRVLTGTVLARPLEVDEDLEHTYGAVAHAGGRLRCIVTRPKGSSGKKPGVLFIQGLTCTAVCDLAVDHPYRRITSDIARQGMIAMRVEKPGQGDSEGPLKCEDMDLLQEADAFREALLYLRSLPDVDTSRIFVFGHSLGGITGPLITERERVCGIATYGTSHVPWFEYFLQMLRIQGTFSKTDPLELEAAMRKYHRLLYALLVERRTPLEEVQLDSSYGDLLRKDLQWDGGRRLLGRDMRVFWDLNGVDLSQAWHATSAPVLSMFGTADMEVMTADAAKQITLIVNHGHPGNGTYLEFDSVDHSFAQVGNMEEEYKVNGTSGYWDVIREKYDGRVAAAFVEWAMERSIKP